MSNLLEQAHLARSQQNWPLLNQCLQQMVIGETPNFDGSDKGKKGTPKPPTQPGSSQEDKIGWEPVLDLALEVLEAGDFQDRWEVAKVFRNLLGRGVEPLNPVIAPLLAILQDEDADIELRWFAGRILAEFDRPEVVEALIALLSDAEDEELSSMAASALANLGSSAIEALTRLLEASESRPFAVQAIAQIRHPQTIEPLLSVVRDSLSSVRSTAIEALSNFDDPRILLVLVEALDDKAASVRREAVIGLGLWAVRPSGKTPPSGLDLANLLRSRLRDLDLEVAQQSAIALARLGTDAAATALFDVLVLPTTPVPLQLEAVRSLGWIGTSSALQYLHQALVETTSTSFELAVLQEIVTVLGRLENLDLKPKAATLLIHLLQSGQSSLLQHPSLKQAAALALGQLGQQEAVEPLLELLADPDASIQLHAIAALKKLAPEKSYQQLEQLTANDPLTYRLKPGVAIAIEQRAIEEKLTL